MQRMPPRDVSNKRWSRSLLESQLWRACGALDLATSTPGMPTQLICMLTELIRMLTQLMFPFSPWAPLTSLLLAAICHVWD
mmetsp:Transcript_12174/g.21553  ORF Transcript_12174/g.21553 Transcript_12174/m.21553 type:complete len:81 (+) Transcript_12174:345-587(+)